MKRLGAIGTMVWDTIHARDPSRSEPIEEWGGICYGLSAFEAGAPEGWGLVPIIKVGADLRDQADRYLSALPRIVSLDGVRTVPELNNRVELFYQNETRRCEKLTGGVPGWTWEELEPLASSVDALYVNFIAGWELDLPGAQKVRESFSGPIYCDLHSIFLGVGAKGVREPRPLARWREWLRCFDFVQINEFEFDILAGAWGDPWHLAAEIVGDETKVLFVTLGDRGAAWVATAGFDGLSLPPTPASSVSAGGRASSAASSGFAPTPSVAAEADPTGCGDVWGMICFVSLLGGASLRGAVEQANILASRNAAHRGASHLSRLLDPAERILEPREQSS
jgi:hypothetical protein